MKRIIQRVSSGRSGIIAHIKSGSNTLNVVTKDKNLGCIYNGFEILKMSPHKGFERKLAHILEDVVSISKGAQEIPVIVIKGPGAQEALPELLDAIVQDLQKSDGEVTVKDCPKDDTAIKETLRSEFKPEKTLDLKHLAHNLGVLRHKISNIMKILAAAKDGASMLTRGKLVSSMWGAKETQCILDDVREKLVGDNKSWDKIDLYSEMLDKSLARLATKFNTDLIEVCDEEKRFAAEVLIPQILDSYDKLKDLLIKCIVSLAPLVYIDEVFKEKTTYPAKWFLAEDVMGGLRQDYDTLIKLLTEIPNIELRVIDPLDFIRAQFINKI